MPVFSTIPALPLEGVCLIAGRLCSLLCGSASSTTTSTSTALTTAGPTGRVQLLVVILLVRGLLTFRTASVISVHGVDSLLFRLTRRAATVTSTSTPSVDPAASVTVIVGLLHPLRCFDALISSPCVRQRLLPVLQRPELSLRPHDLLVQPRLAAQYDLTVLRGQQQLAPVVIRYEVRVDVACDRVELAL